MVNYLKRFVLLILSFLLVVSSSLTMAAAPGVPVKGGEKPPLRVGYIDYDGFIGPENDGFYNGYGVAFLNKISQYTGWKYEYQYGTWEECLRDLELGKIDLVCCAQYSQERAERYDYSEYPIGRESTFIYTRKGSDSIYYQDYSAMEGATAAILKGSYQSEEFAAFAKKKGFSYTALELDSVAEVTQALNTGQADLGVLGSLSRQNDLRIVEKLGTVPFYIITTKGNNQIVEDLNMALSNIYSTSPYIVEELYYEYYGNGSLTPEPLLTRHEAEYAMNNGPFTVACIEGRYPLSYLDYETGEMSGIFPDLVRRIADISGLGLELVSAPVGSRPEELIREGKADIVVGILFSQEKIQETGMQLTESLTSQPSLIAVNSGVNIYKLDEGVLALPYSYKGCESLLPKELLRFDIVYKESVEECFKAVRDHEADLTVQNTLVANYFMQKREFSGLSLLSMQSMSEKNCLMLSGDADVELLSILNKSIICLDDETVNQITMAHTVGRHYHETFTDTMFYYRKRLTVLALLLIAAILGLAFLYRRHLRIKMVLREKKAYQLMAETDEMTGLYNRKAFYNKANEYMKSDSNRKYQIIFFNVESFKVVNELFGVKEGDRLIVFLAHIIREWSNGLGGVCARFEADHFVVCVEDNDAYPKEITERLKKAMGNYSIEMNIDVSCGVYHVHDLSVDVNIMCDRARLAVNSIKGNYARRVAVYDDSHRKALIYAQMIVSEMNTAMEEKQFRVYIQPKYNMDTNLVIGGEALVRWVHPERGIIPPGDFIPIFEQNGFIGQLDTYMFEETCQLLRRWIDDGKEPVPISVNLSRVGFYNPKLCENLNKIAEKYRVPLELLELEVTETAYASDSRTVHDHIQQLRSVGFKILMDDFGSGYSSLNMLKEAPVDQIKLDMRFLSDDDPYGRAETILKMVIAMGEALSIPVLAEGVETRGQVEMLRNYSCSLAQGYYYAKPMTVEEFEKLLVNSADGLH